jgi:hypothetical protein
MFNTLMRILWSCDYGDSPSVVSER